MTQDLFHALVDLARSESVPEQHLSSHWRRFGGETTVDWRQDGTLVLDAAGFDTLGTPAMPGRLLHWIERLSYVQTTLRLRSYPRAWKAAKVLARDLHGGLTYPVFKAAAALAVLMDHWQRQQLSPRTFAFIGDGSGFLGALILRLFPEARAYCIDLPKMLVFQARTHQVALPGVSLALHTSVSGPAPARVRLVPAWELESIEDVVDCAINIASMQEMTSFSINAYFDFLRRRSGPRSRFYCVNREHKRMIGGEIAAFDDYPWRPADEIFIDELCPYYTHYLDWNTNAEGPRMLGVRIPFINYFDGAHRHRLVKLAPV